MNHGHSLRQSFNRHGDSVSFSKRPLGGGADWTNHHIICIGIYYLLYQQSRHIVILTVACGTLINPACAWTPFAIFCIHHLNRLYSQGEKKGKQKKEHSVERSQASSSKHPLSSIQIRSTAFKRKKERLPLSLRDGFSRTRIERKKSNSASIYHYHTSAGQLRLSCSPLGCETSLCWIKSPMTINRAFDFDHASTRIQESRVYHQTNSNFII